MYCPAGAFGTALSTDLSNVSLYDNYNFPYKSPSTVLFNRWYAALYGNFNFFYTLILRTLTVLLKFIE